LVNVYSKCDLASKRRLWSDIIRLKEEYGDGIWCVVGDFNAVVAPEERRGVVNEVSSSLEMSGFREFVEDLNLIDLPLLGRRFTWFHSNGISMSRLDRCLVSLDWVEKWGVSSLWVLPREVSDHCPLVLKYASSEWGPKPFRFNNHWLAHPNFFKVVDEWWRGQEVVGWMGFVLKEKLRGLKFRLKEWNKVEFGGLEGRVENLIVDINDLDVRGEIAGLTSNEVTIRKALFVDLWRLLKSKDATLFQRSRSKWLREGDANSKFFHASVIARSKRNSILALKVGDVWVDSPSRI
jgi:hypothetical protein